MRVVFDGQLALLENSLSRYTRNLMCALAQRPDAPEMSLVVFSPRSAGEIRAQQSWLPPTVGLHVLAGVESPYGLSGFAKLRRIWRLGLFLWRLKPDIYHAHYATYPIPIGYKVVSTLHDVFQYTPMLSRNRKGARSALRKAWDRFRYRMAYLVCVSNHTRLDFLKYLDSGHPNVQVSHSGVDPIFSPEPSGQDSTVLRKWNLQASPYILYVGDLTPRKDVLTLIKAFHQALPDLPPDCKLALTKGIWTPTPEGALVRELGLEERVLFLGHIEDADLPVLYRCATAFGFPSLYEGFGFPPLEAMASGTPVVCTYASSLPEVVGEAALTFEAGDFRKMAAHFVNLFQDPTLRKKLRNDGLAQAKRFTWAQTAESVQLVYQRASQPRG